MRTFKIVAAQGEDRLYIRDGNEFFLRTPYADDVRLSWSGDNPPEMMVAALLTKWDCEPVIGADGEPEPEIAENEAAIIKRDTVDGVELWRVSEIFQLDE